MIYEKRGFIGRITLNRPKVRNAISSQMIEGIIQALKQARADDEVRVVVITGAGKAFCAGADLKSAQGGVPQRPGGDNDLWYSDLTEVLLALERR